MTYINVFRQKAFITEIQVWKELNLMYKPSDFNTGDCCSFTVYNQKSTFFSKRDHDFDHVVIIVTDNEGPPTSMK